MRALSVLYLALFILALSVNANESFMHIGDDEALSISTNENSIHTNADQETKISVSQYAKGKRDNENDPYENLDDIKPEKSSIIRGIGRIIAFIVGAAVLVVIICLVCCCCCPFCLLAKRKERGRVLREGPVQQPQNVGMPVQSGYTIPPDQYQQMQAQQSHPPSGYNAPMPPSVAYPPQEPPHAYAMDQPPPYPGPPIQQIQTQQSSVPTQGQLQKSEYQQQPAYNPNAP